jgi:hypothetical protein
MKKIPYFSLNRYTELCKQFLEDEKRDVNDIHYEPSIKTVMEHVLLLQIKTSGAHCSDISQSEFSSYSYCETENSCKVWEIKHISAGELLKKSLAEGCWYAETDFKNLTTEIQMHYANVIIFYANLLIKEDHERFIEKSSDLKTRIEKIHEGNKKIVSQ